MSLDEKMTNAQHRIEELWNETDGKCYVSFSGGKDSTVLLALIKLCEEVYTIPPGGIPAVFSNTGIELGVTVNFAKWVKKAHDSQCLTVMLLPARTDTSWFHDYIYYKAEIRFLKGRLYFNDGCGRAPFPSMVVIFRNERKEGKEWEQITLCI